MSIKSLVQSFFKQGSVEVISQTPRLDPLAAFEAQFPKPLLPSKTDPSGDDNIILPLVTHIAETSVAHELGDGIEIKVEFTGAGNDGETPAEEATNSTADERVQAWLDGWLKATRFPTKMRKATQFGTLYGHRYMKMVVGADGKPSDLCVVNPNSVQVVTDPRDIDRALSFTISWSATDPTTNREIQYQEITRRIVGGTTDTWEISEWQRQNGSQWQPIGEPVGWPYSQPPIYDCQNLTDPHSYAGRADISAAAIAQNQDVNVQLSLLSRLLRTHANPKPVIKGLSNRNDKNGGIQWDSSGALLLPEGAEVEQLEMQAGGAMAALELVKTLRAELHVTTRTPEVASGKLDNTGPMSGAALAILYKPLDEKTSEKRGNMGEMLERLLSDVLLYAGQGKWAISITWADTTPRDPLAQRQVAQIDKQLGASTETVLTGLGYDAALEKERSSEESQAQAADLYGTFGQPRASDPNATAGL